MEPPKGHGPTLAPAQMSLGEAIALVRAASVEAVAPARSLELGELAYRLASVDVCTTCGWTKLSHNGIHRKLTCGQVIDSLSTVPFVAHEALNLMRYEASPDRHA